MRIGIVVDSCCDLPQSFYEQHNLVILPITVRIGETTLIDYRDTQATLDFTRSKIAKRSHEAETTAYTAEQVHALFLERLVIDYDHVFCLTITKHRSLIHENVVRGSFAIPRDSKAIRQAAGCELPFTLRVIDTQTLFTGQGITAVEAVRMREQGANVGQIRMRLEFLAQNTCFYGVPDDLYYLRTRARAKGDNSIGLVSAMLGRALAIKPVMRNYHGHTEAVAKVLGHENAAEKLFDFTIAQIRKGLLTPTVCLSYGGDLVDMRTLRGYARLRDACENHGVEVYESVMSLTGMIYTGRGCLGVGFAAAEAHDFGG
jgi:DegV family protein with EDD domain